MDAISDDALVSAYINIRTARAKANSDANKVDAEFKEKLEVINAELLRRMNERHNTGFRTEYGSVHREEDFKPSAENWVEVYQWIMDDAIETALDRTGLAPSVRENVKNALKTVTPERFEILEKRLKKTTISEYMKEHASLDEETGERVLGAPPPGVRVLREYVAVVRVNNKS
jgi:hypothetical protein